MFLFMYVGCRVLVCHWMSVVGIRALELWPLFFSFSGFSGFPFFCLLLS